MFFEDIFIHGIRAEFGDAIFTLYKISMSEPANTVKRSMYHSHFYYECHVLLSGETRYRIQGDVISAEAGSLVIIPPYTEHYPFRSEGDAEEIVLGMTLEQKETESDMFRYFFETLCDAVKKPIALSADLLEDIVHFYDRFQCTEMRDICLQQAAAYSIVVQLFDTINRFYLSSSVRKPVVKNDNTDITLELMINGDYSLQDIAGTLGYSARHTSRLIRQKYGKSLTETRQKNMITTAKKLLESTPLLSLEAVAIQSGFSSMDAMTRAFRRWENITPTEYRKGSGCK